jgi:CPA2 family monovalent cation:H+ antiporter-2
VLLGYASQQQIIPVTESGVLVATVALSMALTPALLLLYDRVLRPRLIPVAAPVTRVSDEVRHQGTIIIAGFGQFSSTAGRLLRANGVRPVVLDVDSDRVDVLRRIGLAVYFGDASRLDLLHTAGAEEAVALVIAIGDADKGLEIARTARQHFPHLRILARADDRPMAFRSARTRHRAGVPCYARHGAARGGGCTAGGRGACTSGASPGAVLSSLR